MGRGAGCTDEHHGVQRILGCSGHFSAVTGARPGSGGNGGGLRSTCIKFRTMSAHFTFSHLPGADMVAAGIADLAQQRESHAALLVSIGGLRLRAAGLDLPPLFDNPELRLYQSLARENENAAHGRYNALVRLLVSFERALECEN
jgi:hypothetical protein